MATYASYKKVATDSIVDGSLTSDDLAPGAGHAMGVQCIYNERGYRCHNCARQSGCCEQANGKCCYWCVPTGVSTCLLYTSPSPRDLSTSRMPSSG